MLFTCVWQDLSRLGRDLSQVVIIDNSPASYVLHPENAVSIVFVFIAAYVTVTPGGRMQDTRDSVKLVMCRCAPNFCP